VGRRGVTTFRVLSGRRGDDFVEARGDLGVQTAGGRNLVRDVPHGDSDGGRAAERNLAGQHLENHDAHRVLVGRGPHFGSRCLLGGQVVSGPQDGSGGGESAVSHRVRDAEVGDLHAVVWTHDEVGRLHVAMNDPGVMRMAQCITALGPHQSAAPRV
jgi:hypothetical protein